MKTLDLQNLCHQKSKDAGWWSDNHSSNEPNVGEKICLIHSEISEAMEGYYEGIMDDKLPDRPMVEVEFADAYIRTLDLAGHLGLDLGGVMECIRDTNLEHKCGHCGIDRDFNELNILVSRAMEGYRKNMSTKEMGREVMVIEFEFSKFLILLERISSYLDLDLDGAIKDKIEYNSTREDHKIENRMKDGGKKF